MNRARRAVELLRRSRRRRRQEWARPETYRDWVVRRLRQVVLTAGTRVPYYRDLFAQCGLRPEDIRTPADLARIPVTTNRTVRAQAREAMVVEGTDFDRLVDRWTSGSTGITLHTYLTPFERDLQALNAVRAFRAGGWRPTDVLLDLTEPYAPPPRWIEKLGLFRKRYVPLTEDLLGHLDRIVRMKPDVMLAAGNLLELLAEAIEADGRRLRPRLITTVGEHVTRRQIEVTRKVFGTDPIDVYGATEVGPIAFQCRERNGYHINTDSLVVEIVDPETGAPRPPGEVGRVVITGLLGETMPFLRYSVGDLAAFRSGACPCGRGLPLLDSIQGRIIQLLYTAEGEARSPWGPTIVMEETAGVKRYQLVQEQAGTLTVRIEGGPVAEEEVARRLRGHLGEGMAIAFEYVETLRDPAHRKFPLVISKVAESAAGGGSSTTVSG